MQERGIIDKLDINFRVLFIRELCKSENGKSQGERRYLQTSATDKTGVLKTHIGKS